MSKRPEVKRTSPARSPRERADSHGRSRAPTERVIGLAASQAVLSVRGRDVLNIAYTREARREVAVLLREAARLRIAYREVEREELERMADTLHHEGVCMLVKARAPVSLGEVQRALEAPGFALALDDVKNPHNIGALLRSAAYFGARAVVASGREARLTPASVRVAEGGAEHVPLFVTERLDAALDALAERGVRLLGADAHEGVPLESFTWPERSLIVLGSERTGLSPKVASRCEACVRIPGTGAVESLNVSVAAGILMAAAAQALRRR